MFHDIPSKMLERMLWLEEADAADRQDGTPREKRLRQIPPQTGRFIALLAAGAPPGPIIELGTSAGYSTLWLSLACRQMGRKMTTVEVLKDKAELARETFRRAGVEAVIDLVNGDGHKFIRNHKEIAFCFLDAEKDDYSGFYDPIVSRLVPGGLLVADNVISHGEQLGPVIARAMKDDRVDAVVVPIGKGELVCRRI